MLGVDTGPVFDSRLLAVTLQRLEIAAIMLLRQLGKAPFDLEVADEAPDPFLLRVAHGTQPV